MPIISLAAFLMSALQSNYSETLRPQFHFSARDGWINDPNGLVFYKGTFHLFFQHNPFGTEWGHMTWGHATSKDLVHWTQVANAIEPDSLGTIFSGSAVVDWANTSGFKSGAESPLVAIYACAGDTSPESKGKPFTQCISYSQDAGVTWHKYPGNPVLGEIEGGNRDPKVIWYQPKREWVMALYLKGEDFALYTSPDLKKWTPLQRFTFQGAGECPDFFEIPVEGGTEKKWVFTSASGRYLIGSFDGTRFVSEQAPQNMDHGPNYYAVQTYSDIPGHDGRRIQIAWMNGGHYPGMPFNQQMSFPCRLTLHRVGGEFRIFRQPVREIESLYGERSHYKNLDLSGPNAMDHLSGDLWDIDAEVDLGSATNVELTFKGQAMSINAARHELDCGDRHVPITIRDGRFKLRALIDRTSYEIFGNDGELSFTGCYLPKPDSASLSFTAKGGKAVARSITIRALKSAWH